MVLRVCRKLSERQMRAFGATEKADSTGGHERVSRGNKFRQIVLPALYTVAHEVERSVPSVPVGHPRHPPRDRGNLPPSLPLPPFRRPTVDTCTPVIAGEGDMRLVPLERKRCHFLLAIFLPLSLFFLPPFFSTHPFPLASLLS